MRQLTLFALVALSAISLHAKTGEVVQNSGSVADKTSSDSIAAIPQPAPYRALYQFKIYPKEEAVRAQASLDSYRRAARAEGWDVQMTNTFGTSHVAYMKKAGEKISDIVVKKLKGCVDFDADCARYVGNLNRRNEQFESLDAFEGKVVLPVQDIRYDIHVNAGANYRLSKDGSGKITAIMSRKLNTISSIIAKHSVAGYSYFCIAGECTELYSLLIE
jgi:hypothetical protein